MIEPRVFGLPFMGYDSAHQPNRVDPHFMGASSTNWMIDPSDGTIYRRSGRTNYGGTTGTLEITSAAPIPGTRMRARRITQFNCPSQPAGSEALPLTLYTDENAGYGTLYYYDTLTGGGPYQKWIGKYAAGAGVAYPAQEKLAPNLAGARLQDADSRAQVAAGSRTMLEVNGQVVLPNYLGAPARWNRCWGGNGAAAGNDIERYFQLGHIPPLGPPVLTKSANVAVAGPEKAACSWLGKDMFYYSVVFKFSDGSYSLPFIPRAPGAPTKPFNLTTFPPVGGFGLFCVDSANLNDGFKYITWSNIPIGPKDCVQRLLLRSPKVAYNTAGSSMPDPGDLRLCAIIENNTATTYDDYAGNDAELEVVPDIVRFDHIWPPRARYAWSFDQRIAYGYCRQNPFALIVAPALSATQTDVTDDVTSGASTTKYFCEVTGGTIRFYKYVAGVGMGDAAGLPNIYDSFTLTGTKTLQDLVDEINDYYAGYLLGGAAARHAGGWWVALAPGADGSAPSNTLAAVGGGYGDAFTFAGGFNPGTYDLMRCYGNSWPGLLRFTANQLATYPSTPNTVYFTGGGPDHAPNAANNCYLENFRQPPSDAGYVVGGGEVPAGSIVCYSRQIGIMQNVNGKTGADADYRLTIMNPRRGCISPDSIVQGPGFVGYMTEDGYIINDGLRERVISQAVYNPASKRGAWAYEIQQAIAATSKDATVDGTNYFRCAIEGSLLFVSYRSSNAVAEPDYTMVYDFSQGASYRFNQVNGADALFREDGQTPWGWSSPLNLGVGAIGSVMRSTGRSYYGSMDALQAGTGEGRIEQLLTGRYDVDAVMTAVCTFGNGSGTISGPVSSLARAAVGGTVVGPGVNASITSNPQNGTVGIAPATTAPGAGVTLTFTGLHVSSAYYTPIDDAGDLRRLSSMTFSMIQYSKVQDETGATKSGMTVGWVRRQDGEVAGTFTDVDLDISASTDTFYTRLKVETPSKLRTPTEMYEMRVTDDGSSSQVPRLWGIISYVELLDSVR